VSRKKLQERKKKKREEIAKSRVLRRRKANRDFIKKEIDQIRKQQEAFKGIPIKGSVAERDAEIEAKIRHNLEVLKGLEEAHLKDQEERKLRNETLEAEGNYTLRDKMDAVAEKAKEILDGNNNRSS
jgi:hypothetical protein